MAESNPRAGRMFRIVAITLSVLIWIYLWLRATWVPIAHDEVATFFYYIQHQSFLPWKAHWDANNHILNSALSSLFFPFTGSSALSIRLANLLFFPLYAFYLYRVSLKIHSLPVRWIFLLALLMAHHLVGFFALSRGYGMSMGLLLASVYHLMEFQQKGNSKHLSLTLIFMSTAVLANLSLLNSLLILSGLTMLIAVLRKNKIVAIMSQLSVILLLGVLPVLFFAFLSFHMKELGLLYYGATDSFWNITVATVLTMIADSSGWLISIFTLILFFFVVIIFLKLFYTRPGLSFIFQPAYVFFIFFAGNLVIIQVLRWALGVNYPEDRVGLYLVPMMVGSVAFLSDRALKRKWSWIPMLPFLFFPVHFIAQANFDRAAVYKVDIIPEEFYEIVRSHHQEGEYPPTVGGYRVRIFCWGWLDYHRGGTESQVFWNDYPTTLTDFQIVEGKDVFWVEDPYETVAVEPINNRHLMKRKKFMERTLTGRHPVKAAADSSQFRTLWEIPATAYTGQSLYLGFDFDIKSRSVPFKAWVVACVQDKDRKDIRYEFIALDWIRYSWSGDNTHIRNGLILHDLPPESDRTLLYLWNIDEVAYELGAGEAELYILK